MLNKKKKKSIGHIFFGNNSDNIYFFKHWTKFQQALKLSVYTKEYPVFTLEMAHGKVLL